MCSDIYLLPNMAKCTVRYYIPKDKIMKGIDRFLNDAVKTFIHSFLTDPSIVDDTDLTESVFYRDFLNTMLSKIQQVREQHKEAIAKLYASVEDSRLDCVVEEVDLFLREVLSEWVKSVKE